MIEGVLRVGGTGMRVDPGAEDLSWRCRFTLRPPEFMIVAFVCMHGGSEWYEFSAPTPGHIARLLEQERPNVGDHPRLSRVEVRGPGFTREFRGYPSEAQVLELEAAP